MSDLELPFEPYPCGCRPEGRFTMEIHGREIECPSYVALCREHSAKAARRERDRQRVYDAEHGEGAYEAKERAADAYS